MATLSAVVGILIFYFAARVGTAPVLGIVVVTFALGLITVFAATRIGASNPALSARLFNGSALIPLSLGSTLSAAAIWLTAVVIFGKGESPSARTEAFASALIALIGLVADANKWLGKLTPSQIASQAIARRYKDRFAKLHGNDTAEYKNAYDAIHADALSDQAGPLQGWGRSKTRRRLELIKRAL